MWVLVKLQLRMTKSFTLVGTGVLIVAPLSPGLPSPILFLSNAVKCFRSTAVSLRSNAGQGLHFIFLYGSCPAFLPVCPSQQSVQAQLTLSLLRKMFPGLHKPASPFPTIFCLGCVLVRNLCDLMENAASVPCPLQSDGLCWAVWPAARVGIPLAPLRELVELWPSTFVSCVLTCKVQNNTCHRVGCY